MINYKMLDDPDILPDGRKFNFWQCETQFTKTYYVDNENPISSDKNDGTAERPFRTIVHAAEIVQPGERVFIKKGKYFETIRNVRGGTDKSHMILFEGEEGTVITGAIQWNPDFKVAEGYRQTPVLDESDLFSSDESTYYSKSGAKVFMAKLPQDGSLYEYGYNPFFILNLQTLPWIPKRKAVPKIMTEKGKEMDADVLLQKRGLLFVDGKRLKQVVRPFEVWEQDDVYWVDDLYKSIVIHLKNNENPSDHNIEIALHDTGFMPDTAGLGYLYFKNITFEKFSNPMKCPQYGALTSNCGHHFIIENCRFLNINSVGIDLGFIGHNFLHDGIRGYHIVRGNYFEQCGTCGMAAVPTKGYYLSEMLVENNVFIDNCFHNAHFLYEDAAIKSHYTRDSLYRNNYIKGIGYGEGIWLDKCNSNTRITGNVIMDINEALHGAIFNEATLDVVIVDNNFISGVNAYHSSLGYMNGGNGVYEHECENMIVYNNTILDVEGDGIHFKFNKVTNRRLLSNYDGAPLRGCQCRDNSAVGNVIIGCKHGIAFATSGDNSDKNHIEKSSKSDYAILENGEEYSKSEISQKFGFEETDSDFLSLECNTNTAILTEKNGTIRKIELDVAKYQNDKQVK